jgi:hypothetical protein
VSFAKSWRLSSESKVSLQSLELKKPTRIPMADDPWALRHVSRTRCIAYNMTCYGETQIVSFEPFSITYDEIDGVMSHNSIWYSITVQGIPNAL